MIGNHSVYSTTVPSPHSYTNFTVENNTNDSSEIQCICGFHHDDGFTIACDQCDTWQHGYCVDIAQDKVPEKYECPNCRPRPVDIRRAKEYQLQNVNERDHEEKPRRKKPKSTATTNQSRKKDTSSNIMQTNGPGPLVVADRTNGLEKTNAPKETKPSRKRGSNRASVSTKAELSTNFLVDPTSGVFATPVTAVSNAPSPAMTVATDRNVEGESDTDLEKPPLYRYDFTDITDGKDHYANREIQQFVNGMTGPFPDETTRQMTTENVSSALPGLSVNSLPGNSNSYLLPQHFITVDTSCQKGQLVALCKGEILLRESYKADAINQYAILRHPKPCVFFHPNQPICIDSRIRGSLARFVKRSCRPNTELATIIVDATEIMFGLFATETLESGSALTIGWEWSGSRAMQKLLSGMEPDQLENDEYHDARCWLKALTVNMGDCACMDKNDCVFTKLKVKRESSPPKAPSRTRRGSRAVLEYSNTPISNQGSPERQMHSDREDGNRSSKSRSRDLSPQHEEMSGRDARKMQELMSRFEKIDQGDQLVGNKRRKRNNTVTASGFAGSETLARAEATRKTKSSSTAITPPPSIQDCFSIAASNPTTRKSPDTLSVKSDDSQQPGRTQMQPPPAPTRKLKKPEYVDSAMQTDECEGAWWNTPTAEASATPSRVSLKERLMQSMLREREKADALELRKRKQSEISDSCPSPTESCKEQKLARDSDVKSVSPKSPSLAYTANVRMEAAPPLRELVHTPPEPSDETPMTSVSPSEMKLMESTITPPPHGMTSADIFASSLPNPIGQERIVDDKRTPPISPKSAPIDLPQTPTTVVGRPVGLQVQLPTGPAFPTAPTTPSPMPLMTSSPPPITPGTQSQSPSAMSATNLTFPVLAAQNSHTHSMSIPAKPKKLSLNEYSRRKKVDHTDRKLPLSAVSEECSINPNHGVTDMASPTAFAS